MLGRSENRNVLLSILVVAAMLGVSVAAIAPIAGAQGGPPPTCSLESGGAPIGGAVTSSTPPTGSVRVAVMRVVGENPPLCADMQTITGDFSVGVAFSFPAIDPANSDYVVMAWNETDEDMTPTDADFQDIQPGVATNTLDVALALAPAAPPEPSCGTTSSISGNVALGMDLQPGETLMVRARSNGCAGSSFSFTATDPTSNVPFTLSNLDPATPYVVEAWPEDIADGQPSQGEPIGTATDPVTPGPSGTSGVQITLGGSGGQGGEGMGPPPGLGGDMWFAGTSTYAGTAVGQVSYGLGNENGAGFTMESAVGAFNITGLIPGHFGFFAWIDTDGVGGPGAFEPLGWIVSEAGEARDLEFSANVSDATVVFRDAPEEGWPPEYFGGPGGGGGGSSGGCTPEDTTGRGDIVGSVTAGGSPVSTNVFVHIQNVTARTGESPQVGSDGTFACNLPPGSYRVEGNSPDYGFYQVDVTLTAGETETVNLPLSFNFRPSYSRPTVFYGGTVWGNVTVGGVGVDNVRVSLFRSMEPGAGPGMDCQPANTELRTFNTCGAEAETNSSGGFVITHLADGVYNLMIDGQTANPPLPNHWEQNAVTISGADSTQAAPVVSLAAIDFDTPAMIKGYVNYTSTPDDVFVERAQVNAWPQCMSPGASCSGGWDETNETGYYEMAVSPGRYGMQVMPPSPNETVPALQSARVDCGDFPGAQCVELAEGQSAWRNFTLARGSTFRGRIVDAEGDGVRGWINAQKCPEQSPNGPYMPCDWAWGQTDMHFGPGGNENQGWFNLTVQPGAWELRFEPDRFERPDLSSLTLSVTIGQGETIEVNNTGTPGEVRLGAGLRLRGNVTAGGEPVAYTNLMASVHVESTGPGGFRGPPIGWAFTDENGAYDMTGLPPLAEGQSYDIRVEPAWGSSYMGTTEELVYSADPNPNRWLDIALSGGGTLEGYVTTSDGLPVEGAFVDAFYTQDFEPGQPGPMGPGEFPASGGFGHDMTDANGFYSIGGLTTGTFGMWVRPPTGSSYTSANLDPFRDDLPDVTIGETTRQDFELGSAGSISGCIEEPDGTIVPYAWVSAFSRDAGFGGGEPSGNDGCFTIRGVAAGSYDVEINPPWNSDFGRMFVRNVEVETGETLDLGTITLQEGVRFAGTVLDGNGDPVANAFVNVFQITEGPSAGPGVFGWAQTDGSGVFNISGLQEGRYGAHVQPPWGSEGLSSKFIPEISIPSTGRYNYAITLGGGGYITGSVAVGGTPLANAWVGAWSPSGGGSGTMTDANGEFNLSGLSAAADYNFDVFPPWNRQDLAGYHEWPVTVVEGQETQITVSLETGGSLIGHVQDANGEDVQYAFINVNGDGTFGWGMTDSEGNFSVNGLRADAGDELTIFVQPNFGASFVGTRATHTWAPNADSVSDAGTITVSGGVNLTGRVTRGGSAVADVEVNAWPTLPYNGPPIGGRATTNETGYYTITGLPDGQAWDISAQPQDGTAGNFTANAVTTSGASTTHNVELGGGGTITVTVNDGSAPIQGARVDCFSEALRAGRGNTTDASGIAGFVGLPTPGDYVCRVFAAGYIPGAQTLSLTEGATLTPTISLATATTVDVYGNFTNASGTVEGFFVLLVPSGEVDDDETTGFDATNSTGAFQVLDLPTDNGITYDLKIINSGGVQVASRTGLDLGALATGGAVELGTIAAGSTA